MHYINLHFTYLLTYCTDHIPWHAPIIPFFRAFGTCQDTSTTSLVHTDNQQNAKLLLAGHNVPLPSSV